MVELLASKNSFQEFNHYAADELSSREPVINPLENGCSRYNTTVVRNSS